jgi:hypothetical protein
MIEFKIISIEELKDLIYLSYENDAELVKRFHSINIDNEEHSLEECVDTTYNRIIEAGEEVEHDIFKVLYNGEDIGYMVIFGSVLYSFAIFPSFRKKDILNLWWEEVKELFGGEFGTLIYNNNIRCLIFLLKNDMKIVAEENNILLLKNI